MNIDVKNNNLVSELYNVYIKMIKYCERVWFIIVFKVKIRS